VANYVYTEKRTGEIAPESISVIFVESDRFTKEADGGNDSRYVMRPSSSKPTTWFVTISICDESGKTVTSLSF